MPDKTFEEKIISDGKRQMRVIVRQFLGGVITDCNSNIEDIPANFFRKTVQDEDSRREMAAAIVAKHCREMIDIIESGGKE